MENKFEEAIEQLILQGYGIVDEWLPENLTKELLESLDSRYNSFTFKKAEIGTDTVKQLKTEIRSDEIFWIDKSNAQLAENEFLQQIDLFLTYLNSSCFAGLSSHEFHYAVYESGTFYARHKDQFKHNDNRKFSMVLYLNKDWKETDGGELVIYDKSAVKIAPIFGRLVFFNSVLEHEVLQSNFQRKSVTGWLRS